MNSGKTIEQMTVIRQRKIASRKVGKSGFSVFRRCGAAALAIICCLILSSSRAISADSSPKAFPCFSKDRGGLIKDIQIHGAFPLFERDIVSAMTLYVGTALDPARNLVLSEQNTRLESYLKAQGFIRPFCHSSGMFQIASGAYVVQVNMDKGHYQHLENIRFTGNHAFSAPET